MTNSPALPYCADQRLAQLGTILLQLMESTAVTFHERLHGLLPDEHGIYAIYAKNGKPGEVLRAGRTKTAAGGLRQRIYRNHFMGDQQGNLRSQLLQQSLCKTMEETKHWIRANCTVQYVVIEEKEMRRWAEYHMLAVLQPKCCD
jgi:hypothetical protein